MQTLISILSILAGLLIRLAIPIVLTAILIFFLRRLDARWQVEAPTLALELQKPECWKIKKCRPEQAINCAAPTSPVPCWQVFRSPNGYLQEECLKCEVFTKAPIPALKAEPRRM